MREFWLNVGEESEDACADMDEFAKVAEALGCRHTQCRHAVGERIWRKVVRLKLALSDSRPELGLSATDDDFDQYEEPAREVQTGCIAYAFKACAYFCGVLAAR